MSYFYAAFNKPCSATAGWERIFADLGALGQPHRIHQGQWVVTRYEQDKVIPDLVLQHHRSNSWIVLIGMPLLKVGGEAAIQAFIDRFLDDSAGTIRSEIDGHFALIAYDAQRQRAIIASDANSFIPIFYVANTQGVLISSSELALAKLVRAEINPLGFSQAVSLGATWDTLTRFQNIAKLLPCEVVTIEVDNRLHRELYWEPSQASIWPGDLDAMLDQWMPYLGESVQRFYAQSTRKETVWSDFTAGEDARLVIAQCHALGLPYKARVDGFPNNPDIAIARRLAQEAQFELSVESYELLTARQAVVSARDIALSCDGYGSFFYWGTRYATDLKRKPRVYRYLHMSGMPGGEAFRGTYYRRAKLLRPSVATRFDYPFFTRLKYLLDDVPGLLKLTGHDFVDAIHSSIRASLIEVDQFPAGTQVDHLLRRFQTCIWGLSRRKPFYHPLGTQRMTQSIYAIPPHYKQAGTLTRACTERLFPRLARLKTEQGVPTIRRSLARSPLFWPEYLAEAKKISNGLLRRFYHMQQNSNTLAGIHRAAFHEAAMHGLFHCRPYASWFASADSMLTGGLYQSDHLNTMLDQAKAGGGQHVEVLGRLVNQELACRYVYSDRSVFGEEQG